MCVEDTVDGGASMWMRRPNGDGVPVTRWAGVRDTTEKLPEEWPGRKFLRAPSFKSNDNIQEIPIRCHCKGVDLVYRRSQADVEFSATEPHADLPRMVDPATRKPMVGMDACDSCRISFGVDFCHWTFSSLRHIDFAGSAAATQTSTFNKSQQQQQQPLAERLFPKTLADLYAAVSVERQQRDPRFGTLAVYASSDRAKRYFCSRCSACVFYAAEARHDVVNVAMGLLDVPPPEGARAEGAFVWLLGGQVQHREDIAGGWREKWLHAVEAEFEAWRVERKFPEWWRWVKRQPEREQVTG